MQNIQQIISKYKSCFDPEKGKDLQGLVLVDQKYVEPNQSSVLITHIKNVPIYVVPMIYVPNNEQISGALVFDLNILGALTNRHSPLDWFTWINKHIKQENLKDYIKFMYFS